MPPANGKMSFWVMMKRYHDGMLHYLSEDRLHEYVNEFVGRHSIRTMVMMGTSADSMVDGDGEADMQEYDLQICAHNLFV